MDRFLSLMSSTTYFPRVWVQNRFDTTDSIRIEPVRSVAFVVFVYIGHHHHEDPVIDSDSIMSKKTTIVVPLLFFISNIGVSSDTPRL